MHQDPWGIRAALELGRASQVSRGTVPQVAKTQPKLLATQAKGWTHSYDDGWPQRLQASGPRWALGVLLPLWGAADCGLCETEGKGSGETQGGASHRHRAA